MVPCEEAAKKLNEHPVMTPKNLQECRVSKRMYEWRRTKRNTRLLLQDDGPIPFSLAQDAILTKGIFEELSMKEGFNKLARGALVRICLPEGYFIGQITKISTGTLYDMKFESDKYLEVKVGDGLNVVNGSMLSPDDITREEFDYWMKSKSKPTKRSLRLKANDIQYCMTGSYSRDK